MGGRSSFQFVDNRPEAMVQKKQQAVANNSPRAIQLKSFQAMADNSPQAEQTAQLQAMADDSSTQKKQPVQKKVNNTGLPDSLKSGVENLSGFSMNDVKVHYNSDKPAQLSAHAYAQGTDIHLSSGQEKHLPHEAWHVVQQKQGRVKPTMQMKGKVNINDNEGLEKEADLMGAKALQCKTPPTQESTKMPMQFNRALTPNVAPLQLRRIYMPDRTIVITEKYTSDELHDMIATRFMARGTLPQLNELNAAIEAGEFQGGIMGIPVRPPRGFSIPRAGSRALASSVPSHSNNVADASPPAEVAVETPAEIAVDAPSEIAVAAPAEVAVETPEVQHTDQSSSSEVAPALPGLQAQTIIRAVTGVGLVLAGAGDLTRVAYWSSMRTPIRSLVFGRIGLLGLLGRYGLGYTSMAMGGTLLNAPTSFAALTRGGSVTGGHESGLSLSTWLLGLGLSAGSLSQIASMAIRRQTLNGIGVGFISRLPYLMSSLIILSAGQRLMGDESSLSETYRAFNRESSQPMELNRHGTTDFLNFILAGGLIGGGMSVASRGLVSDTGFMGESLHIRNLGPFTRTRYLGLATLMLSLGVSLAGAESILPHLAPGTTPEHPGISWDDPLGLVRLFAGVGLGAHGYGSMQQAFRGINTTGVFPRLRLAGFGGLAMGTGILLSGAVPALGDDWRLRAVTGSGMLMTGAFQIRRIQTDPSLWRRVPSLVQSVTSIGRIPVPRALPGLAVGTMAIASGLTFMASCMSDDNSKDSKSA
ncbi:MAG: DUF4157 domain-containing protein [Algicola sp.]|nr:DUF4157 domain-containing protein [Algicola sp.]